MTAAEKLRQNGIRFSETALAAIASQYQVESIDVFGSSLRDDVTPASDVDLLVIFRPGADPSLFDLMNLERELEAVFGRAVDVVEPDAITNPIRRDAIFRSKEPLFAA